MRTCIEGHGGRELWSSCIIARHEEIRTSDMHHALQPHNPTATAGEFTNYRVSFFSFLESVA